MKNNKHVESFGKFNENLNITDVSDSKILYEDTINGNQYQLLEIKETEFTGGEPIMVVYKDGESIDIDGELNILLKQFKTLKLKVDDMCKYIHFYDKFNELCV
jgi:hypothetical protein